MKILEMEIGEEVDDFHKVFLDGAPTSFKEHSGEPIRSLCLVGRQGFNCPMNFLFCEIVGKAREVAFRKMEVAPIKITRTSWYSHHGLFEVRMNGLLNVLMLGHPSRSPL
jgi:hypothetical protein